MKDTATRAREAGLRKLRRDAIQLIFWLSVGFIAVLVTATAARAFDATYHNAVLVQHNDGWRAE